MRVLVDTHAWLWMMSDPERLSEAARAALGDPGTDVLVSAASAWEIGIKHALGKLPLPQPASTYVPSLMSRSGSEALDVTISHALRAAELPLVHRDPFDRLLVAQSQALGIPLCSGDELLQQYDVEILWS